MKPPKDSVRYYNEMGVLSVLRFTLVPRQETLKTDPDVLAWIETVRHAIVHELNHGEKHT